MMNGEQKTWVWFCAIVAAALVSMICILVIAEDADNRSKRERLELILNRLDKRECAPISADLVRELAK